MDLIRLLCHASLDVGLRLLPKTDLQQLLPLLLENIQEWPGQVPEPQATPIAFVRSQSPLAYPRWGQQCSEGIRTPGNTPSCPWTPEWAGEEVRVEDGPSCMHPPWCPLSLQLQQLCLTLSWVSDHHHNLLALVQLFLDVTPRSRWVLIHLGLLPWTLPVTSRVWGSRIFPISPNKPPTPAVLPSLKPRRKN